MRLNRATLEAPVFLGLIGVLQLFNHETGKLTCVQSRAGIRMKSLVSL